MFDLYLRKFQEVIFLPFAKLLASTLTPNQITLIAFAFGLLCSVAVFYSHNLLGAFFFLLNRVSDALDGVVARMNNQQSDFGGHLDIVTDMTVYSFIPVALTFSDPDSLSLQILPILLCAYFVNATSLFHLSSLLEKHNLGASTHKETTSVAMPPAVSL